MPKSDLGVRWLATALVSPRTSASENGSLECSACSVRPKRWQATASKIAQRSSLHPPVTQQLNDEKEILKDPYDPTQNGKPCLKIVWVQGHLCPFAAKRY